MRDKTIRNLIQKVEHVLWNDWDPIGVNTGDEWSAPDDEYNSYAPHIAGLLVKGVEVEKIAKALGKMAESSMGLNASPSHDIKTAKKLYLLKHQDKI